MVKVWISIYEYIEYYTLLRNKADDIWQNKASKCEENELTKRWYLPVKLKL